MGSFEIKLYFSFRNGYSRIQSHMKKYGTLQGLGPTSGAGENCGKGQVGAWDVCHSETCWDKRPELWYFLKIILDFGSLQTI